MNSKTRFRSRIVLLGILCAAGLIIFTLYKTQVLNGKAYVAKADKQYAKPSVTIFNRGSIFFETKTGTKVSAATVSRGSLLYLNSKLITDADQVYQAVSQYVKLDKNSFIKSASSKDSYVEVQNKLDVNIGDQIRNLHLAGVGISDEAWRAYPAGALASHTLGIIGESQNSSSTELRGRYGLERSYNDVLSRVNQGSTGSSFASLFDDLGTVFGPGESGKGDLVTTIEPTVQDYLEKILTDTAKEWNPEEIGGIIMDPQTGEIVGIAAHPSFDPNDLSKLGNVSVLSNPIVEHVHEMGSIMKPLTMVTGLDTGVITPTSTYDDTGCMTLNTKTFCNFDGKKRGVIPMQEILSQSLNVGAATVALKIGKENMQKYFVNFGLGTTTGIDLPNEATGLLGTLLKQAKDIDLATASFGQGIAVSPLEMARALSILTNGGKLVTPHLVKDIEYSDGTTKTLSFPTQDTILKPESIAAVVQMMVTAVDTKLANGVLKQEHYTVAAKTGTAEIADPVKGGYYPDKFLHSFFGFFPAYHAKYIVFLYQVHPQGAKYASETLTKPFDELAKFLINYYDIPPDR